MFVEHMDGTIRGYPISLINEIYFSGEPIDRSLHEQELVQKVLSSFAVYQNYPNPFNPSTAIQYDLPKTGEVEVNIFDIQGRLVRSLASIAQQAGTHTVVWDGRSNAGVGVSSGTYLCRIGFNTSVIVKKLVLLK
jgi:hypothetical protein